MIKLLQVEDSSKLKDLGEKTEKLVKEVKELKDVNSIWENFNDTLEAVIWPLALILSLYIFRIQIKNMMDRFKSLKITKDGAEFSLDNDIDATSRVTGMAESAKLLIAEGLPVQKSSGDIIPKSSGDIIPKSDKTVTPKKSHAESPYQELLELQDAINQKLKNIANQNGINTSSSSNFSLTSVLAEQDVINSDTAHKLKMVIELNNKGLNSPKVTHDQVSKIKRIFNNISF